MDTFVAIYLRAWSRMTPEGLRRRRYQIIDYVLSRDWYHIAVYVEGHGTRTAWDRMLRASREGRLWSTRFPISLAGAPNSRRIFESSKS